ncbi:MAG TPA: hypothetical protein DDW55_05555 [Gammaproteobacteria bacterium]|nr:hypothetical protein [Gammaproteobacteria bacterium]
MNKSCLLGALTARRITITLLAILLSISAAQSAFATTVWSMPLMPIMPPGPPVEGTDEYMLYLVTDGEPSAYNYINGVYLDNITLGNTINPTDLLDAAPSIIRDISSDVFDYTADEEWISYFDPPPSDTYFYARISSILDYHGIDIRCRYSECVVMANIIPGVGEAVYSRFTALNTTYELVATNSPIPTPIPSAMWLFGSGLFGLIGMARRRTV